MTAAASWGCYLLRCADDTLYCGITNDLDKRLAAHNAGTAAKLVLMIQGGNSRALPGVI